MIQISYRDPRPIYEQIKRIQFSAPIVSLNRKAISALYREKGVSWRMQEIRLRCGGKNFSHSCARSAQS